MLRYRFRKTTGVTFFAKLPGETSCLITDLIGTDANYSDFRNRLYNRAGISHVAAGMKLFSSWVPDFNDRKVRECSTELIALLKRFQSSCETLQDAILTITMALFRQALGKNEQFVLDSLTVTNEQEFLDAVDRVQVSIEKRKERQRDQYKYSGSKPSFNHSSPPKSFKCDKLGHKALE